MKNLASPDIDRYRIVHPVAGATHPECRPWEGVFILPKGIRVIASRAGCPFGEDRDEANNWDHASVSTATRCPTWEEMEFVKRLFFERDECAMQLHVPPAEHINNHEFCLHIWRPLDVDIPRPPSIMVGVPAVTGMAKAG